MGSGLDNNNNKKNNPFREDPELVALLAKVNVLETRTDFNRWKKSFKEKYDRFLHSDNSAAAEVAYNKFRRHVHKLLKLVKDLQNFIDKGQLVSGGKVPSVKARLCLSELQSLCVTIDDELLSLLPGSSKEEKQSSSSSSSSSATNNNNNNNYTNFHMGSVLIADEFSIYSSLAFCDDFLQYRSQTMLEDIVEPALLQEIDKYHERFNSFCEIMASLGLFDVMLKAHKIEQEEKKKQGDIAALHDSFSTPELRNKRSMMLKNGSGWQSTRPGAGPGAGTTASSSSSSSKPMFDKQRSTGGILGKYKFGDSSFSDDEEEIEKKKKQAEEEEAERKRLEEEEEAAAAKAEAERKRKEEEEEAAAKAEAERKRKEEEEAAAKAAAEAAEEERRRKIKEKAAERVQMKELEEEKARLEEERKRKEEEARKKAEQDAKDAKKKARADEIRRRQEALEREAAENERKRKEEKAKKEAEKKAKRDREKALKKEEARKKMEATKARLLAQQEALKQQQELERLDEQRRLEKGRKEANELNYSFSDQSFQDCDLDEQTRRRCYMWYARMGQPTRDVMKKKVSQLGDKCDISLDDVNRMPWGFMGQFLPVDEMNKYFVNVEE